MFNRHCMQNTIQSGMNCLSKARRATGPSRPQVPPAFASTRHSRYINSFKQATYACALFNGYLGLQLDLTEELDAIGILLELTVKVLDRVELPPVCQMNDCHHL